MVLVTETLIPATAENLRPLTGRKVKLTDTGRTWTRSVFIASNGDSFSAKHQLNKPGKGNFRVTADLFIVVQP